LLPRNHVQPAVTNVLPNTLRDVTDYTAHSTEGNFTIK